MNAEVLSEIERIRQLTEGDFSVYTAESAMRVIAEFCYADAAMVCRETWKNAPNDRPEYRQNAISHGCIACAEAIEDRAR